MKRTLALSLASVLLATLALAGPAVAGGKGKAKGNVKTKAKACSIVTYVLAGPTLEVDPQAGSVTMAVAQSNKHAAPFLGENLTVRADTVTKVVRDDVKATLADLVAEDDLTVKIRGCKGIDPATLALVAQHVDAISPLV